MSDFLQRAMKNVENVSKKPVAGTPKYQYVPEYSYDKFVTDFDFAQFADEANLEEEFRAVTTVYLNLSMGQSTPEARKKVRHKVAKAYKDNRLKGIDAVYQSLRQLDANLEQEMKAVLIKDGADSNPL